MSRYTIFVSSTRVESFRDLLFENGTAGVSNYVNFDKQLQQVPKSFTTNTAIAIARRALPRLGIPEATLEKRQPIVRLNTDVNDQPLPYFFLDFGNVQMEVSGAASNVVELVNWSPTGLRVFPPTNYLEIVGATNEALRTPQPTIRKHRPPPPDATAK